MKKPVIKKAHEKCIFKVLKLEDKLNDGSELVIGNTYHGELDELGHVWYTDKTDTEWVFYPGDTCHVISITASSSAESRIMFIIDTLRKKKIKVTVENISVASLFTSGGTITTPEEIELVKKLIKGYQPGQAVIDL